MQLQASVAPRQCTGSNARNTRWFPLAEAKPRCTAMSAIALIAAAFNPGEAFAVDGCLVMLCFAAPDWRQVRQCVDPIRQVLHDLAHGKPFPECSMAGSGNKARNRWAQAPNYCPPQYMHVVDTESGPIYSCDYAGAVSVFIDGRPFVRTWWNTGGDTVTQFSSRAKDSLGTFDTRFDDDYAAWRALQPEIVLTGTTP